MKDHVESIDDLSQKDTARLVMDMFHRIVIHYALWFTEVRHQMGLERALNVLKSASEKSIGIQLKRLSKSLGFEMKDGLPEPLLKMPKESLQQLLDTVAVNWLANDGVWFQAVEFSSGTSPWSTLPLWTSSKTAAIVATGTSSALCPNRSMAATRRSVRAVGTP